MNLFVILESIENWWTTTGGISTVAAIVTGALTTIAGLIMKCINEYRSHKHDCPKHCITKKPLKSKKKPINAKPKG